MKLMIEIGHFPDQLHQNRHDQVDSTNTEDIEFRFKASLTRIKISACSDWSYLYKAVQIIPLTFAIEFFWQ